MTGPAPRPSDGAVKRAAPCPRAPGAVERAGAVGRCRQGLGGLPLPPQGFPSGRSRRHTHPRGCPAWIRSWCRPSRPATHFAPGDIRPMSACRDRGEALPQVGDCERRRPPPPLKSWGMTRGSSLPPAAEIGCVCTDTRPIRSVSSRTSGPPPGCRRGQVYGSPRRGYLRSGVGRSSTVRQQFPRGG